MRNFYQSNTAASNNLQFGEPLSPNEHDQIVIRHNNTSLSCSFSSKNKLNLNNIKTNLPMPLTVNHESSLNTVDYLIHNNSSYNNNINCNDSGAISTKRRVKLNNYNLSSLSLASRSSLSPTSSSVSSSSSVQTKSKFINTQQSFLNMNNTPNNNNNNVSRPSLNHSHLNISNHLHHSNYSFISNNNNHHHHTDNFVSMTSTDLLPVSASSNESSSSLSSSLSVEASTANNSHHQITTSYVSNHIYHQHQQHLLHHHNQQKQFQIQPPIHFSFKENNKFIVKKNSSVSSKTSSSSSSAYSSIGSTTSSPAPSPNSSCNLYFNNNNNNNNNGEDYQTIKQNAHLNSNELSHISLKDNNYEPTVNNFISLFNEQDLTQTPLTDNNQSSKKSINNTNVNSKYKNHHKTLSRDCYSKMLNQEQNERFFESNTLYKKELKQKQRDLLNITASPTTTTSTNNSVTTNNQFKPSAPSPINESSAESTNSSSAFTSLDQQNSPSPLTNSKDNYSTSTHLLEPSSILKSNSFSILSSQNVNFSTEPNSSTDKHKQNGFNLKKEKKSSNQSHSNKMLNLFSNLLNRNKPSSPVHLLNETNHSSEFSNTSSNANNTNKEHGNGNYLNLKYLKRAASSTHFNNKSQNDLQLNRKSSTSKFLASAGKITVLSDQQQQKHQLEQSIANSKDDSVCKLFNGTVNSKYNDENMNRPLVTLIATECDSLEANENRFLRSYNRRSYDDATMSLNQSDQLVDNSFSGKFENTAFSTKNNGLIFLPSPKACESSGSLLSPSGGVDTTGVNLSISENVNNYENFDPHLSVASSSKRRLSQGLLDETNQKSPVQLNIINLTCINNNNISNNSGLITPSKPAVDRERAANLLDDSGAFDNAVYSYVDNIRQHSKRLSEINMFSTNSPATSSNKYNEEQNMNRQSLSVTTSSASSAMNKNTVELPIVATTNYDRVSSSSSSPPRSHNLTLATDQSLIQQRSSSPCIHVHENSFENQSYVRISTTGMNPKPKINSVKLNSPASSLASSSSSSSSSSNYSSNFSISPKSLVSSETIVINSNLIRTASNMNPKPVHPTTPTSNVMSLREKFEQFTDTNKSSLCNTPCSSNTKLNRNSAHILTYKEFKTTEQNNEIDSMSSSSSSSSSSSKSVPHSIPIIYQSNSLTSSMSNMSKNENNNMNNNLVISTSATQISQQHPQTNSPVSTMSSVSSLSDSSIKDSVSSAAILPTLTNNNNINNDFNPTFSSSSSSSCSNYDQSDKTVPNEFDFNFLYEFFPLRPHPPDNTRNTCEFYLAYEESVALFIKNYHPNKCFFLHHVLNPCVVDLDNVSVSVNSSTSTDSFCFKFTIDYLKTSIFSKFKIKSVKNDLSELVSMNSNDLDDETKQAIESTNNNDCYNHLFHNLISTKETANLEQSNEFELDKNKLKSFIHKKISFYVKYLGKTLSNIEANNDLGKKILGLLEQNLNITCLELDKYKLLVSEIDVINNLLLKLCNKLANTENSIQIMQLKQMQDINQNLIDDFITQKFDSIPLVSIPESNEEIELLKQELNQIQRKKEEAIFLRNGIDKRATTVSDYLINYLNKDHHQEFELFIQMKNVYAVQLRHIKDHIELSQLQLKLIEDLV